MTFRNFMEARRWAVKEARKRHEMFVVRKAAGGYAVVFRSPEEMAALRRRKNPLDKEEQRKILKKGFQSVRLMKAQARRKEDRYADYNAGSAAAYAEAAADFSYSPRVTRYAAKIKDSATNRIFTRVKNPYSRRNPYERLEHSSKCQNLRRDPSLQELLDEKRCKLCYLRAISEGLGRPRKNPYSRRARFKHVRLAPPRKFKKGSFRTIRVGRRGKELIVGRPRGSRRTRAQSLLIPKRLPNLYRRLIGTDVEVWVERGYIRCGPGSRLFASSGGNAVIESPAYIPAGKVKAIGYRDDKKALRIHKTAAPWKHDFNTPVYIERGKAPRSYLVFSDSGKPLWRIEK